MGAPHPAETTLRDQEGSCRDLSVLFCAACRAVGIAARFVSGYLYGFKESLLDKHENCSCNYVPHLYEYVDMCDIAALIAPRPLLVETGTPEPVGS